MRTITFNELRKIKDSLPEGSIHRIAESLQVSDETVRNYFGGANYKFGQTVGIHIEKTGRTVAAAFIAVEESPGSAGQGAG